MRAILGAVLSALLVASSDAWPRNLKSVDSISRNLKAMEYMSAMTGTRPGCYPEKNYDYVGNDMSNEPGKADECCDKCLFQASSGCRAYTWTDYNGGTCWLKRGRGKLVWRPNAVSAVLMNPGDPVCALEANIDYVGNDIGNALASSADKCCAACEGVPNCRAFSWSNYNGGTCWFKSTANHKVIKAGVTSALPFGEFPVFNNCGLEQGVDYVGNDIGNTPASKPEECCDKCSSWGGCRAFSWTNHNGGTCWLKNLKGDTVANPNVVSSVVKSNPIAPSCALEIGVDYADNDIGNARSADAYGCCSICWKTDGCKAFSWSSYNGGTCWLKSAKGSTVNKDGVKSAVVVL